MQAAGIWRVPAAPRARSGQLRAWRRNRDSSVERRGACSWATVASAARQPPFTEPCTRRPPLPPRQQLDDRHPPSHVPRCGLGGLGAAATRVGSGILRSSCWCGDLARPVEVGRAIRERSGLEMRKKEK
jgi:hypothetical protein